jgi:hypothetical protein
MELQQAVRKRAKIKMGLQGPSGSGKTYSSLLLAFGMCGQWDKVAVIDTENHSAELYAHLGNYNVVNIGAPYSPEKYIQAIDLCVKSGIEVIVIDSISHEWDGIGGILDIHGGMLGNSFTNWSKVTPRHNQFIQAILQTPVHFICTIRSKQDYVLSEKNGKLVPEKVGLKGVTKDGVEYEFTIVFDIDIKHNATSSKDRTGLFADKPEFKVTIETGKKVMDWCNSGAVVKDAIALQDELLLQIEVCTSKKELVALYNSVSVELQSRYKPHFSNKGKSFETELINSLNTHSNGTITSTT